MRLLLTLILCSPLLAAWTVDGDSYAYRMSLTTQTANIDANEAGAILQVPFIGHPIGSKMSAITDFRFADDANSLLPYETDYASIAGGSLNAWFRVAIDVNAAVAEPFWFYADTATPSDGSADIWDANTILVWHMQEASWSGVASEVVDSSGEGNHGTAVGDATTIDGGYFARGGTFDGDGDSVSVALNLGNMDEFTISMWVAQDDWLASGFKSFAANYGIAYNGSVSLYHRPVTPTISQVAFALVDTTGSGATARSVRGVASNLLGWNQVTAVYSSEQTVSGAYYMELYINGSIVGNTYTDANAVWTPDVSRGTILFGNCTDEPLPFTGQMDEVRIYNRALDTNEVSRMYYNDNEQDHELDFGDIEPAGTPTPGVIVVPVVKDTEVDPDKTIALSASTPIEGASGELRINLGIAVMVLTFTGATIRLEPRNTEK